jgi:hypothetical protein
MNEHRLAICGHFTGQGPPFPGKATVVLCEQRKNSGAARSNLLHLATCKEP